MWQTANALQLDAGWRRVPVVMGSLFAKFVLRMRMNCYTPAFDQNSDIGITFNDRDFLKESNNLTSDDLTLTFNHLTLNICSTAIGISSSILFCGYKTKYHNTR